MKPPEVLPIIPSTSGWLREWIVKVRRDPDLDPEQIVQTMLWEGEQRLFLVPFEYATPFQLKENHRDELQVLPLTQQTAVALATWEAIEVAKADDRYFHRDIVTAPAEYGSENNALTSLAQFLERHNYIITGAAADDAFCFLFAGDMRDLVRPIHGFNIPEALPDPLFEPPVQFPDLEAMVTRILRGDSGV